MRDMHYELSLLRKIGKVKVNGIPFESISFQDKYVYWHQFSQSVFSSEIVQFSQIRNFDTFSTHSKVTRSARIRGYFLSLLGVGVSVVAFLYVRIVKPRVVVFGIDRTSDRASHGDFRIASLYTFLRNEKISFIECFHTIFNFNFIQKLITRKRLGVYVGAIDSLYQLLFFVPKHNPFNNAELTGFDECSAEERKFAEFIVRKYLQLYGLKEFRVVILSRFLSYAKAEYVFAIDDARNFHDISLAANRAGIPCFAFQHGHFTPYHVGWLKNTAVGGLMYPIPDYLVVWSEYWKKELIRLDSIFPEDAIIVGGKDTGETLTFPNKKSEDTTVVLIPHETDSPKVEVESYITQLLHCKNVSVIMKLRADHSIESQLAHYPNLSWGTERLSYITHISELNHRPHVSIGTYSTFLYETVSVGIPTALFKTSLDYGVGMVLNDLASEIVESEICRGVETLAQTPEDVLRDRAERITSPHSLQKTLADIVHGE